MWKEQTTETTDVWRITALEMLHPMLLHWTSSVSRGSYFDESKPSNWPVLPRTRNVQYLQRLSKTWNWSYCIFSLVTLITIVRIMPITCELITITMPDMSTLNSRSVTKLAAHSGQISPLKYFTRYLSFLYIYISDQRLLPPWKFYIKKLLNSDVHTVTLSFVRLIVLLLQIHLRSLFIHKLKQNQKDRA